VRDLQQIGSQEAHLDSQEQTAEQASPPETPIPDVASKVEEEQGGDQHRGGHGHAVGGGQVAGGPEAQDQAHAGQHQGPVHERNIDLPHLSVRGVVHLQPGQEAELHGLHRQREGPGDQGLGGDHGGSGGQQHHRVDAPGGDHPEEGVLGRGRVPDQQGSLAEIVEQQGGEDEDGPGPADGRHSEVPHVGVQGLASGDGQEHGPQHQESRPAVAGKQLHALPRRKTRQHRGFLDDLAQAQQGQGQEPGHHDGAEDPSDLLGAVALGTEQGHQDPHGDRQDVGLEEGGGHIQAFDRAEDRDRRRDHPVPIEQRGTEQAQHHQDSEPPGRTGAGLANQRGQGQDPALPVMVRANDEEQVLHADNQEKGPQHQRQDPHDVGRRRLQAQGPTEGLLQRIQRAGPDVSENDAQGSQGQGPPARRGRFPRSGCVE